MDVTVTEPAYWQSIIGTYLRSGFVLLTGISAFLFQSKKQDFNKRVPFY